MQELNRARAILRDTRILATVLLGRVEFENKRKGKENIMKTGERRCGSVPIRQCEVAGAPSRVVSFGELPEVKEVIGNIIDAVKFDLASLFFKKCLAWLPRGGHLRFIGDNFQITVCKEPRGSVFSAEYNQR